MMKKKGKIKWIHTESKINVYLKMYQVEILYVLVFLKPFNYFFFVLYSCFRKLHYYFYLYKSNGTDHVYTFETQV